MLIDFHAHTSGISKCCRNTAQEILEGAYDIGIDGIILTNHYQKSYISYGNVSDFIGRYIDEYYYAKSYGEKLNMKVLGG